jgi:putative transposase
MSRWKIISGVNLYFITTTVVERQNIFVSIPMFEIIIESLKYCIAHKGLHFHAYVIMPNHAHYIVYAESPKLVSNIRRDFNRHTSKRITELLEERKQKEVFRNAAEEENRGNRYKVWQEGFHPIGTDTAKFFQEKLEYLHDNLVKKGFVEQPEQWRYSSAKNIYWQIIR